jgi:hypothetical protein
MDYTLHRKTGHPPRGPSAGWWVQMTANAAGTNGWNGWKHGEARDNEFLVTHLMNDQRCLTFLCLTAVLFLAK